MIPSIFRILQVSVSQRSSTVSTSWREEKRWVVSFSMMLQFRTCDFRSNETIRTSMCPLRDSSVSESDAVIRRGLIPRATWSALVSFLVISSQKSSSGFHTVYTPCRWNVHEYNTKFLVYCQVIVRREGYSRITAAVQVVDGLVRFAPNQSD